MKRKRKSARDDLEMEQKEYELWMGRREVKNMVKDVFRQFLKKRQGRKK